MNKIRLLEEHLIDQIKAGEVIESPANLLKEILENALDAQSTKLKLQIRENGLSLISLEDNGMGISFDDIPYAFLRHATSKIEKFEDIYGLSSYGFRGEALASIAAISKISCTSVPEDKQGGKIEINAGQTIYTIPYQSEERGTHLYIKDLFYNTPVRLKFTKSKGAEKNRLKKIIDSFLLSHPNIHFSIQFDDEEKDIFTPQPIKKRIQEIFYRKSQLKLKQSEEQLICESRVEYEEQICHLFFSADTFATQQRTQLIFVNGRYIEEKGLQSALARQLERFWEIGKSGSFVLFLELPKSDVDVNVHPSKTKVSFKNSAILFTLVKSCVDQFLKNERAQSFSMSKNENFSSYHQDFKPTQFEAISSMPVSIQFENLKERRGESAINESNDKSVKNENGNLFDTSKKFLITNLNGKLMLLHLDKILFYFIEKELKRRPMVSEEQTIPLLITRPFTLPLSNQIDDLLEKLKMAGIEIDRIDPNDKSFAVLRTIPDSFSFIEQTDFIAEYINDKLLSHVTFSYKDLYSSQMITRLLEVVPITEILEHSLGRELSTERLMRLLK